MNAELMASGLVEHLRSDGFKYRLERSLDWMVCDIVEKPARNAVLLEPWIGGRLVSGGGGQPEAADETALCRGAAADAAYCRWPSRPGLACRQLYHDREEVTFHARRL